MLDEAETLKRAFAVDPEGGVELIRRVLRADDFGDYLNRTGALDGTLEFATRDAFRKWLKAWREAHD